MQNKKILIWRAVLSFSIALVFSIFINMNYKEIGILSTVLFLISFTINKQSMIDIIDFIIKEENDKKINFFYKCSLVSISLSVFITLIVLVLTKNNENINLTLITSIEYLLSLSTALTLL